MICPHCRENVKRKERTNHTCSKCKKRFALDPKENPLKLHDVRLQNLIDKLHRNPDPTRSDGGLFYTSQQLLYAAARKIADERHRPLRNIVLGTIPFVIMGLFIAICGQSVEIALAFFGIVLFGLMVRVAWWRLRPFRSSLPVDPLTFERSYLQPWAAIHGPIPGLISQAEAAQWQAADALPQTVRAILISLDQEILLSLQANGIPQKLQIGLLPATQRALTPDHQKLLEIVRHNPHLPLILVHDAAPGGVMLPRHVINTFRLSQSQRLIDLGLHPHHAIEHKLMVLGSPVPPDFTKTFALVNDRNGRTYQATGLRSLSRREYRWLKRGCISPLSALTPARLIKIVTSAVEQHGLKIALPTTGAIDGHPEDPSRLPTPPDREAQRRAIGFLTWPEAVA